MRNGIVTGNAAGSLAVWGISGVLSLAPGGGAGLVFAAPAAAASDQGDGGGSLVRAVAAPGGGGESFPGPSHAPPGGTATGVGACCLPDAGCEDVGSGVECGILGGVLLPGQSCASAPCGVGACCFQTFCAETDAYSCISVGRDFVGAGTQCEDDACNTGLGACCIDIACQDLPVEACSGLGGTWLGFGSNCIIDPCEVAACCAADETCSEVARYVCEASGGTFLSGAACIDEPCTEPNECPDDSLFSRTYDTPEQDGEAGTSEFSAGFRRFDDFFSVPGPIEAITWWGLDLHFAGGFSECVETDPTFDISFHEDAGGFPGNVACTYSLTATRTPLGILYLGAELNEYSVVLPEPCVLVHGWISIVGLGDPDCWFLWMSSGDEGSYCLGCTVTNPDYGLSFCLQGTSGGVAGACCDDGTGLCADGVDIADCIGLGERFRPGEACADLVPACGVILGACCFPDATCSIELEDDCGALGGNWLGANSLCAHCPCLTPCPDGGVDEGEGICESGYVDAYNGGCFSDPEVYSPITGGVPVCGLCGVYLQGLETVADFDWYEITLAEEATLTWTVTAEFRPAVWLVDGREGCPGSVLASTTVFECVPASVTAHVLPGTYWGVVAPAAATDSAACGARYTARMDVTPPCLGDLDGSGDVGFADLLLLLGSWGSCGSCVADLDGDGAVEGSDVRVLLGAWGACP